MPGRSVSSSRVTTDVLIPRIYMLIRRRTVRLVPLTFIARRGNVSGSQHPERRAERVQAFISRRIIYKRVSERARESAFVRARARTQREAADYFLSPMSMQQSCRGIHRVISRFFSLIDLHATSSRIMSVSDESVVNRSLGLPASRL